MGEAKRKRDRINKAAQDWLDAEIRAGRLKPKCIDGLWYAVSKTEQFLWDGKVTDA
jgi:hypothetical protein